MKDVPFYKSTHTHTHTPALSLRYKWLQTDEESFKKTSHSNHT